MTETGLRNQRLLAWLQDPADGSAFERLAGGRVFFAGGGSYPIYNRTPILIDEQTSLFSIDDIVRTVPTTQAVDYRSPKLLRNYVRQRLLPPLSVDRSGRDRYAYLAQRISGGPVLVIGTGDKEDYYRSCFPKSEVITSDVHCQFGVDLVLDAHRIPFCDATFSLVLLAQVLEHTARPWMVAKEVQRVTRKGGYIQVETPFFFPVHGAPYDFYRFTPSALRILFPRCKLIRLDAPEGPWSSAAIAVSQAFVDSFSNRYLRMAALVGGRLSLWWMKYLDRFSARHSKSSPKGYAATYLRDGVARDERRMLAEIRVDARGSRPIGPIGRRGASTGSGRPRERSA